jgi:hypothetical protein
LEVAMRLLHAMPRLIALLCIAGHVAGDRDATAAPALKLDTWKLENGLTVAVRRLPGATYTAVVMTFQVGQDHDPEMRSGLASVIASLYLAAPTASTPPRAPDTLQLRWPAKSAMFPVGRTFGVEDGYSYVAHVLAAEELPTEIADAAERLKSLTVREEDVASAKAAVTKTIRSHYGPENYVASTLARARLVTAPFGGQRIGIEGTVAVVTLDEVNERLTRFYRPANALLAVVGDVEVGAIRSLVKKHFAALPPGEAPPAPGPRKAAAARPGWEDVGDGPAILHAEPGALTPKASAALLLSAPPAAATLEYAAFLLLAGRLADRSVGDERGAASTDKLTVSFAPWLDSAGVQIYDQAADARPPADVGPRLQAWMTRVAAAPLTKLDVARARTWWNPALGLQPLQGTLANDPLGVALSDARRTALGIDGEAVAKLWSSVKVEDLRAAAARPHRVVVVLPK